MARHVASDRVLRFGAKPLLFMLCLIPFGELLHGALTGDLGANPLERVTDVTGQWGLRFLLIGLAIAPLRRLTGWGWPLRLRRMLGLFAFFYISLHLLTWVWIDQGLSWSNIVADILKRPYVTVGFLAWALLVPLALTSTRGMVRRLGRRWQQLHRAVYLAAILGVLHYIWLVKADMLQPAIYASILFGLLLVRMRPGLLERRSSGGRVVDAR